MVHDVNRPSHPCDLVGYTKFGHSWVPLEDFLRSICNLETPEFSKMPFGHQFTHGRNGRNNLRSSSPNLW